MSLARSASGPPGLSINTGAANALGSSSLQPAASGGGGLFGSGTTNATSTPGTTSTTGGMFGAVQQKPTGLSLFQQPQTNATTAATTGAGLLGGTNAQQNQGTTVTGLFGNAGTNQAQPQQQQQQAPGTGLFGQAPTQNQQQPATTGTGLFPNLNTNQQTQPQTAVTGLFGASGQQQQQQQQQQQPPQQQGGGLFGQSQAKPTTGLFGQSQPQQNNTPALGQSTNQVSAVQINYETIRTRTRFDDLAKPVQEEIALLDKGIQRVIKMKDEIGEFMPQHERDIDQLGLDVKFVESKFKTVQVALNNDIQTVKALQDMTKKNIADAQLSFKATDNLRLPAHYHQTGLFASSSPARGDSSGADAAATHANAQDLITYFNRICDDIEKYKKRLDEYRAAIERDMPGVENGLYDQIRALQQRSSGNAVVQDQLGEVLAALRDTGNAIIAKAGQIAETRERLARLQAGIVDSGVYAMGLTA